jgi:hypothetical protein
LLAWYAICNEYLSAHQNETGDQRRSARNDECSAVMPHWAIQTESAQRFMLTQ